MYILQFNKLDFTILTIILLLVLENVSADSTFYFPGSVNLDKLIKLNNVKMLRLDLIDHIKYVDDLVKKLDRWAFNEIKFIANYENLNNYKIIWLEKEMNLINTKLDRLIVNLTDVNVNITAIKLNYNTIQNDVEKFNDHFGEKTVNSLTMLREYYGEMFPNLVKMHKDLLRKTIGLHTRVQLKEREHLILECIENIKNMKYEIAVNKLHLLNKNETINDDEILNEIVKIVYNRNDTNFEIVLKFGNTISNITKKFHIYKLLMFEMQINQQANDGNKLLQLIESLKNNIIYHQMKTHSKEKTEALALEEYLLNRLKIIAKENLKEAILNDTKHEYHIPFLEKILQFDEKLFVEINLEIMGKFYRDNGEFSIFGWLMEAFTEVFGKIFHNNLNDETVMKLAYSMEDLTADDNGEEFMANNETNLNKYLVENLKPFKNQLPESVRHVVFTKDVCIKNVGLSEYLMANNITYEVNKFYVYTTIVDGSDNLELLMEQNSIRWTFHRLHENIYHIINNKQNYTTFLYSTDIELNDELKSNGHRVFTWIPDTLDIFNLAIWKIIPIGEHCFIKNVLNNEYLTVSSGKNHFSYTLDIDETFANINFRKWLITECTNINNDFKMLV